MSRNLDCGAYDLEVTMKVGDTFLFKGHTQYKSHFWIVIAKLRDDCYLAVYLTTKTITRSNCVLQKGEHHWIKVPLTVAFWQPLEVSEYAYADAVKRNYIISQGTISDSVLAKILQNAKESEHLAEKYQKIL